MSKKSGTKVNEDVNNNNSEILVFKILIVGDTGVGKSNFIYRYTKNKFSRSNLSTVGFESNSKEIEITNRKIIVQLWDSAGQDKFKSITKTLFNRVQGIIILYDITDKHSFLNVSNWIKLIQETNNMIPFTLAGNKCDLKKERVVEEEEVRKLSEENGIVYMETSAKYGINVMDCVNNFVKNIINSENFNRRITFALPKTYLDNNMNTVNKSEKCC
jgi:Ras-related protein Rab-1A